MDEMLKSMKAEEKKRNNKPPIQEVNKIPGVIWHYTDMEAFLQILKHGTLRFSEAMRLNDSEETEWLERIRNNRTSASLQGNENFTAGNAFDYRMSLDSSLIFFPGDNFISCFSHHPDKLSQWLNYAANGKGIAIGFNKDTLFNNLSSFYKKGLSKTNTTFLASVVHYYPISTNIEEIWNEFESLTSEIISSINTKDAHQFLSKVALRFFLKNHAFKEEEEFRILSLIGEEIAKQYRSNSDGKVIPFYDFNINNQSKILPISAINLGPKNVNTEGEVKKLLEDFGLKDIEIKRSSATYR